jgi:hypothetical protein
MSPAVEVASEYILMRRDQRYKLVWYLGEDETELYDLEDDPGEVQRARRDAMVDAAKDWSIRGLLETRRPPAAAAPQLPTLIGRASAPRSLAGRSCACLRCLGDA